MTLFSKIPFFANISMLQPHLLGCQTMFAEFAGIFGFDSLVGGLYPHTASVSDPGPTYICRFLARIGLDLAVSDRLLDYHLDRSQNAVGRCWFLIIPVRLGLA